MNTSEIVQVGLYFLLLTALAVPLGGYIARVYSGRATRTRRWLGPVENGIYRLAAIDSREEMSWQRYVVAILLFNLLGFVAVYLVQRFQGLLPLNPDRLPSVSPEVAFNTAVSFVTNTNWQAYGGETTVSYLTQMLALTVQNFLSAATGMAVLVALVRGLVSNSAERLGNFWVDLVRTVLYILLPLSLLLALLLASQGVVQTLSGTVSVDLVDRSSGCGQNVTRQSIAVGPVASQVAIKQLGTNGGGFFNANSAHPFENPTPISNLLEMLSILLIPAALCFSFGSMVRDRRQGWALFSAMLAILVPLTLATLALEKSGTPALASAGADLSSSADSPGGNMEGKEVRFGIVNSALWATATTASSNGSVNAMHDSFTPLAGMVPLWLIQIGEVVFGGIGSGLYGMLIFVIVAVFIAGMMIGRTPEYLGKKIEAFEMKMACLVILVPAVAILIGTAVACFVPEGTAALGNPGPHGFSEMLYAFSSAAGNNGSAFGGLTASGPFYAITLGICMLVGRYWIIVPVLAIAGSMARKKKIPTSPGTLPTHTPMFVGLLIGTIVLVGALTFIPALALGPIVEQLQNWSS